MRLRGGGQGGGDQEGAVRRRGGASQEVVVKGDEVKEARLRGGGQEGGGQEGASQGVVGHGNLVTEVLRLWVIGGGASQGVLRLTGFRVMGAGLKGVEGGPQRGSGSWGGPQGSPGLWEPAV